MKLPTISEARGISMIGYQDLNGQAGFKMALYEKDDRWYLYTGHLWQRAWSVLDVTDPTAPELLNTIAGPDNTWTIQVQAADGLLITALEKPVAGWGIQEDAPYDEGALFWALDPDPANPRLLSHWRTGAEGTHRNFYSGGRYAFMTANLPNYYGNQLVVLDVADPSNPRAVGRWHSPLQEHGEGVPQAYLHGPAYVHDNLAFLSYGRLGLVILDVSEPTRPSFVSSTSFGDLGTFLGCHSAVPLGSRDLVIVNSEAIEEGRADPLNYVFCVDVSDPAAPLVVGSFPTPTPGDQKIGSYYDVGGRFGPHNQHHYQGNQAHSALERHVVMTFFNAGIRIFDTADERAPREVAHFVPGAPPERRGVLPMTLVPQFEDVIVDRRGNIYCTDKNYGVFVLRTEFELE